MDTWDRRLFGVVLHVLYSNSGCLGCLVQFVKVLFETVSGLQEEEKTFCERPADHHEMLERIEVSSGK